MFIKKHRLYGDERIVSFQIENRLNTTLKNINFVGVFLLSHLQTIQGLLLLHIIMVVIKYNRKWHL
jgi:hypothetical protein